MPSRTPFRRHRSVALHAFTAVLGGRHCPSGAASFDDQAEARVALSHFLSECGARVTALSSGLEALAWLADPPRGGWPDVLVCDIAMPDADGYSVLAQVRALESARGSAPAGQLPAIALTALARSEDRLRALTAGFHTYVAKPVEPAELVGVIASVLRPKPAPSA